MGQKKLIKFQAIDTYANVLQYPEDIKGKWHEHFRNNNPITLELACGKGEYSVNLGREHKDRNYIGVDIKGNRIYTGAKTAIREGLCNVSFLRAHIGRITNYFAPGEVSEIWIIFPDPFLRKSRAKKLERQMCAEARIADLEQQIADRDAVIAKLKAQLDTQKAFYQ